MSPEPGPKGTFGYKDFLLEIKEALNSKVRIHWTDPDFLLDDMRLEPFSNIPYWIPLTLDPEPGFQQISNQKAIEAGLVFTKFSETVKGSLDSYIKKRFIPEESSDQYFGISMEKEDLIISEWKKRM